VVGFFRGCFIGFLRRGGVNLQKDGLSCNLSDALGGCGRTLQCGSGSWLGRAEFFMAFLV